MNNDLQNDISNLHINKKTLELLKENDINTIYELCMNSRTELTNLGIDNSSIKEIIVSLQLLGLDLKRKQSKKNSTVTTYMNKRGL